MSDNQKICPHCDFANGVTAQFCGNCGRELAAAPAAHPSPPTESIYCPYCETPNPEGSAFCGNCGRELAAAPTKRNLLLYSILATALVFLIALGAFFLLPHLLPGAGQSTDSVTVVAHTPTATPPDPGKGEATRVGGAAGKTEAPAQATISPVPPTLTPTSTPWPTVTPEPTNTPTNTPTIETIDEAPETESRDGTTLLPIAGDGLARLSFSTGVGSKGDYTPTFAPDQSRIVYSSIVNSVRQLVQINTDGSGMRPITAGRTDYREPDFSPDGKTLLVSYGPDDDRDIILIDSTSGAHIAQLTTLPGKTYSPHWLSDGTGFIFSWMYNNDTGIYLQYLDGRQIGLARSSKFVGFAWPSPGSRQVAFYSSREDSDYEIYVMDIDGGNQRRLTFSKGRDASPTWSPDGRWIAFESDRNGTYHLFAMRPDGSDLRQLTSGRHNNYFPAFSPDGRWIVFQSDREKGAMNIYRMPFAP